MGFGFATGTGRTSQMTKQAAAGTAFLIAFFVNLYFTSKLGRGDSTEPEHALQTRQDIGSIYGSLSFTNALLAAILAALVF
jgi:hypothetical protein